MQEQQLTRVFRFGSMELADPDPSLPPGEAVNLYATNYSVIKDCTVSAGQVEGDRLIYDIERPPVKTKG